MLYSRTIRKRKDSFFGSPRRTREYIRSCRLFCIVPWEQRRLYIITAQTDSDWADYVSAVSDHSRAEALAQADSTYSTAVANAQSAYTAAESATESAYTAAMESANSAYTASLEQAQNAYETSVIPALTAFNSTYASITCLYSQAVATIDNDTAIGNNYYETEDAEVCFVAGTPILMADGTSKPIEEICPGDMVLAVDHNDLEKDTPKPAKVTRFFDNGLKSVVKLIFENQKTKEQFEVVCTPSHRFYVVGNGWTTAENLQSGDPCQSANGEQITILSRESLDDQQHVYDFEVNEKHTYYVESEHVWTVLVHNECSTCHGTGTVTHVENGMLQVGEYMIISLNITKKMNCPICQSSLYTPEEFAKRFINPGATNNNWGFCSYNEKYSIYAYGCVGISMVSLENYDNNRIGANIRLPHLRDDANIFLTYDQARAFYLQCRKNGQSPVLMMYVNKEGVIKVNEFYCGTLNKNTCHFSTTAYDYRLLALIDQGKGPKPVWIHAQGGWKNPSSKNKVIVTPIDIMSPGNWRGMYIVIPSAGREGLGYILNWNIPNISSTNLPLSFDVL